MPELDAFIASVLDTYDLPSLPGYQQAIATMIMHLGPLETHKSKIYFARSIRKAAANQIAYEKIQQLKKEEQESIDKEKAKASESKISDSAG